MKRIFIALPFEPKPPPLPLLSQLKNAMHEHRISWVQPSHLHITLKFIGECGQDKINDIVEDMKAFSTFAAYSASASELGLFGSRYNPKVIWLGIHDKGETTLLASTLSERLVKAGVPITSENFVPHITLGRVRKTAGNGYFIKQFEQLKKTGSYSFSADRMVLFESILKPTGPQYEILHETLLSPLTLR